MVNKEAEDICQDESQHSINQVPDTLMGTVFDSLQIKEEPEELHLKQVEVHSESEPQQVVKKETQGTSQDENQDVLKLETDALMVLATHEEKDDREPEPNGNQIFYPNFPKGKYHHEMQNYGPSGSCTDEQLKKRAQKTRGQSENVEKTFKHKKTNNG
ncbi:hypothetical protein AMECASPLE_024495 [Ameca splendens]|uniref:Uncharacterized protein n=1 Tax=Ameca splendens TaxID=208324 RepID=A0ABV0ZZY5_9TELE